MISDAVLEEAAALLAGCRARGWMLATAESCTGGLIAATLTAVPGASDVVDRGFVIYSNDAKMELLGVQQTMLAAHGAISEPVVCAMAEGALTRSRATITVAVTGLAGPGGGSVEKPVGLVWFGLAQRGHEVHSENVVFPGDRTAIRAAAVTHAFRLIRGRL
ncbi:MAG TPA: CinA family protein [Acetobacteraceae bacterium]|nr:CinA family protein [Acetobacteraceae bacterium]